MALFDDEFYSPKVSRKSKRKAQPPGNFSLPYASYRSRRSSNVTALRIVLISALTSAATMLTVLGLFMWYHNNSGAATASTVLPIQQTAGSTNEQIVQVAERVRPAVVSIVNYQDGEKMAEKPELDESALGSGVIFRKDNGLAYIVTNNHVISGADQVDVVLTDGTMLQAKVEGTDFITDIAVLSIKGRSIHTIAPLGDSDQLQMGEAVLAIGNPLGFNGTMTSGIISYNNRLIPISLNQDGNYDWEQNVIQTDAAINEGNSGGALVNMRGELIGINTMKIMDTGVEGLGFAIPINEVMEHAETLMTSGKIDRPYLGVYSRDLDDKYTYRSYEEESDKVDLKLPDSIKKGAVVIEASGPAQTAGLKENDVIIKLDKQTIGSTRDLRKYLYDHKQIGDQVTITYYHEGKKQTTSVQLKSSPVPEK